ncbi:copper homeostasis membrane protein CopD [Sandaracinobacter sp. RS1-74]|uniref:copper homeostasis membrane protein CopD n=1 Tax=Sandaracinobacteroides sayramensis TaxID=2913411 RepID=UPI001EDC2A6C|nr:copper homeostasis membrane protein CopD [Sandaracinobacteroides sayramensis]MCG2841470.1 copper homeostasis membrane protein CopD [Sandaracinobacteroides sayramensis]
MDGSLVAIRWSLYADLGLLFGLLLFALCALKGSEREELLPLRWLTTALAGLGIVLSGLSFVLAVAAMLGVDLKDVDHASVMMVLTETPVGWALLARILALAILCAAVHAPWAFRGAGITILALIAAIPVASLAWSGHGAASEGLTGMVHLVGDILHLLAASAWIGALAAFILILSRHSPMFEPFDTAHRALAGFATAGTVIVGLILVTGLVNSYALIGPQNMSGLFQSAYGRLLLIKLVLFGLMLALAASNRFSLTPALATGIKDGTMQGAVSRLRRSLWLEVGIGILILALVAWLGTLLPPASAG